MTALTHPFPPVYDRESRILILGSFPSVRSREVSFFYGHPRNRFWRVLSTLFQESEPRTTEEKTALLLRRHIALWDVIERCEIIASSDASIRNAVGNDLGTILEGADIRAVFCNGGAAHQWYRRLCERETGRAAILLPSTSPANARWSLERLTEAWGDRILPYL